MRINPLLVQSLASLRTALETQKNAAAEQEKLIRTQRAELEALRQDKLQSSQSQSTDLNGENDGQGSTAPAGQDPVTKAQKGTS